MSNDTAGSLRRALNLRLAGAGLAALLALVAVLGAVYALQRQRLDESWMMDARAHFDRQTRSVETDWVRQADLLRAQVEFSGLLDGDDERLAVARFTAFMASMGGLGTFNQVVVQDSAGRAIVAYATRSGTTTLSPDRVAQPWAFSEADGLVYRVLRAPMRLGNRGRGELVVYAPLNNALLSAIAFPDTRISLHWQGRQDVAVSVATPASSADSPAPGARLVEGSFDWAGAPGGPQLHVQRVAQEVLPLGRLLPIAAAGVLGGALLAWLTIGRWARRHARVIDALSSMVDAFAAGRRGAAELGAELSASSRDADVELRRLGDGLGAMMRATEQSNAAKETASRRLADANATLEQRVAQRTQQLAVARDEALAAARAKEQILAGVSHELRTPLVGLLGSLELAELSALPPEQRRLIEVARRSGQALRNVIDDVLDYSRLEAVGAELRQLPFHVDDLAAEAVAVHAAVALNKGLHLQCDCDDAATRVVRGDPVRLRQVLLNLVGNAVKFTDRGRVDLRVRALPSAPDSQRVALRFEVQDTGIGIEEDSRARLFSPFAQGGAAHSRARGGTGLGLAIAQRLIVAMGGRIELHSVAGVGSTFWFELELPLADAAAPIEPAPETTGPLQGRVLLAEDNPVNRVIASEMLRRLGLEVEEAENGMLALEALRRRPADLVLMDQQMPVLDGLGATARIRSGVAGAQMAAVPIVAFTAHAQEGDAQRCLDAGMDDYLAKPFTQAELARTLGRWLRPRVAQASDG